MLHICLDRPQLQHLTAIKSGVANAHADLYATQMALIDAIEIAKIHGGRDVLLPFKNGHCILIGPNGTVKSTALQISAYMLGRKWLELANQPFEQITVHFQDGKSATISRSDCNKLGYTYDHSSASRYSRYIDTPNRWDPNFLLSLDLSSRQEIEEASARLGVPTTAFRAIRREIGDDPAVKAARKRIQMCIEIFEGQSLSPTLFLPTYRRIELELKKLFDEVPDRMNRQLKERQQRFQNGEFLLEVIRFGMDDVLDLLTSFERETRDYARNQFNRMMTSYLKDMAAGKAMSVRELRDIPLTQENIDRTLSRIEEGLLDENEKSDIGQTVIDLSQGRIKGNPSFHKSWLAHFFIKLYNVNNELEQREKNLTSFISAVNNYISPKQIQYDIESYHTAIIDDRGIEIKLSDLSSGEKQIISMLAEVHFRDAEFNLLIDEPELSLSVPWQLRFLTDIKSAQGCGQVMAVTHSPFIYDNSLANSVVEFGYG